MGGRYRRWENKLWNKIIYVIWEYSGKFWRCEDPFFSIWRIRDSFRSLPLRRKQPNIDRWVSLYEYFEALDSRRAIYFGVRFPEPNLPLWRRCSNKVACSSIDSPSKIILIYSIIVYFCYFFNYPSLYSNSLTS